VFSLSTVPGSFATVRAMIVVTVLLAGLLCAPAVVAQSAVDWRQTGNAVADVGLAGNASGPATRVWYANGTVRVQTGSGRIFETSDFERWRPSSAPVPPSGQSLSVNTLPEPGARAIPAGDGRFYALGDFVYRSDDGGKSWENLTAYRGRSIVGAGLHDLAVAPDNSDEVVVAGDDGLFRSVDGGKSWSGINDGLPNFAVTRILDLPAGDQGLRVALWNNAAVAWPPGNKLAWLLASNSDLETESRLRAALSAQFGIPVTAVGIAGDSIYVGTQTGEIRVSADRGLTWLPLSSYGMGAVERFWIDPRDPREALAALGTAPEDKLRLSREVHVVHTVNGGAFWDDWTANLPASGARGIAADRASGAIYVATDHGVFLSYADLGGLGAAQPWTALSGLPAGAVTDVRLDVQGNQLWAAVDGYGVYSTLAPHRLRDPSVVSAADLMTRAVAPGSLVTVLGAKVDTVRANGLPAPVLAATATESQIQIPFEVRGNSLSLDTGLKLPSLPLADAAPVIFVARDGSPMLLDAERGVLLDAMTPAHSGTRVQILAAGLGRVVPAWPAGVPATPDKPPHVAGAVHAYLDRVPVEVTRAELAPGYIGFYLVEINVPRISNYGPAELYIDVDGAASNRVRVYIEPSGVY
jgi:uncharacterized protein (TIGR03437 family)